MSGTWLLQCLAEVLMRYRLEISIRRRSALSMETGARGWGWGVPPVRSETTGRLSKGFAESDTVVPQPSDAGSEETTARRLAEWCVAAPPLLC